MAEPLWCQLCGAEDWSCGHRPFSMSATPDHGPEAFCEVSRCVLYEGERCGLCVNDYDPAADDDTDDWTAGMASGTYDGGGPA